VIVGIRPDHLSDAALRDRDPGGATLEGEVRLVEALGSELMVHFQIEAARVRSEDAAAAGEDVAERSDFATAESVLGGKATGIARIESGSQIRAGTAARFAVESDRLYFFDPAGGEAIRG
jgi:multiple sugar transport system ATP-binding protein